MHGLGVTERVVRSVPEALVPVLEVLTALGDPAVLAAAVTLGYWHGPGRVFADFEDGIRLVAASLVGLAGVAALKPVIGHARPPAAVTLVATDGFALPSGHATGAAAVFVAAAVLATVSTRRRRLALAAGGVALVSFTRVALGVHYALDVLAGAALGTALSLAALALTRERAALGLWLAALVGALGFVASGATDPLAAGGVAAGGALGWTALERRQATLRRPGPVATLVGLLVVGGLLGATLAMDLSPAAVGTMSVGSGAILSGLPAQNFSR